MYIEYQYTVLNPWLIYSCAEFSAYYVGGVGTNEQQCRASGCCWEPKNVGNCISGLRSVNCSCTCVVSTQTPYSMDITQTIQYGYIIMVPNFA